MSARVCHERAGSHNLAEDKRSGNWFCAGCLLDRVVELELKIVRLKKKNEELKYERDNQLPLFQEIV